VHGLFLASGIVMIYRLHHDFGRRKTGRSVQNAWVISGEQRWVSSGKRRSGSGFKVGFGYMVIMPKAAYLTWHGHKFEGRGVVPYIAVPWSPEAYGAGNDNQLEAALNLIRAM